jgi:hypothetical protein
VKNRLVLVAGLLACAALGGYAGWEARSEYEQEQIAADEAAERDAIYGGPVNLDKPWTVPACGTIAAHVERGYAAQEAGGKKSLFMASTTRRLDPSEAATQEALREISESWDRYIDGLTFVVECIARIAEKRS